MSDSDAPVPDTTPDEEAPASAPPTDAKTDAKPDAKPDAKKERVKKVGKGKAPRPRQVAGLKRHASKIGKAAINRALTEKGSIRRMMRRAGVKCAKSKTFPTIRLIAQRVMQDMIKPALIVCESKKISPTTLRRKAGSMKLKPEHILLVSKKSGNTVYSDKMISSIPSGKTKKKSKKPKKEAAVAEAS